MRPAQHRDMLLRMAVQCLEHMAAPGNTGSEHEFAARYPFMQQPGSGGAEVSSEAGSDGAAAATAAADRALLLQFAQRLMLYQPATTKGPSNPLAAAAAAVAAAAPQPMDVDGAAALPPPPPGMSRQDVAAVEGKAASSGEALLRQKLGLLNWSAAVGWDPTEMLPVYLAAACDPGEQVRSVAWEKAVCGVRTGAGLAHPPARPLPSASAAGMLQVSRRGDELLKKRCGIDAHKPTGEAGWRAAGWHGRRGYARAARRRPSAANAAST